MKHIYDYLADHAAADPEKIALSDVNGEYTYAELDKKSSALARRLLQSGLGTGDAVAVYVPYVKELILGTFAAMRAGGVYLPLEYSYPNERLQFMLADSSASALLTLRAFWAERPLDFPAGKVIFMDDDYAVTAPVFADLPMDAPAMILYTSGTTGRPKGVILPHTMMVTLMDWAFIHEGTKLTKSSRAGIMSGLTFSATTLILYSPFMYGGTVILAPEPARKDMELLYRFLIENGITHTFLPAGLATTIVEHYDLSGINIFAGGEKLRNFRPLNPDTRIINTYGCTELGAFISAPIRGDEDVIPVGLLSPDTEAMITDEALRPVKQGEVGELIVRNARMAKGYLGLPEQTKAKWVVIDGKTWYRTGDRARQGNDGLYYVLGRTDNMIKIRGFRVETGEVESQIAAASAKLGISMRNNAVVVRTVNGIDHLTCYYESAAEADTNLIKKTISVSLASYMVPDIWVRVDAMPRNANGKIVRVQLPKPKSRVSAPGTVFSEAEARVVEAAASVLGISTYISPEDGFASLGGTSIKSMEFAVELRNAGIHIGSADILKLDKLRTIAEKAQINYERFWSAEEYERIRADFASRGEKIEKVLPITAEQDEALFDLLIHPDQAGSRKVIMLQTDSLLNEGELREALDTVSSEFNSLRSAVVFHKVTVIQQVITNRTVPVSMRELPEGDYEGLRELCHTLSRKYCDLQRESSVQVICAHIGTESFLLVLDYMAGIDMPSTRRYLARLMGVLSDLHPGDEAIASWKMLFEMAAESISASQKEKQAKGLLQQEAEKRQGEIEPIHVYSEGSEKKIVFVHTGNTGSEAYYSLAERIGRDYSFSVLEPFNLYHPDQAAYGIKSIAARYVATLKKYQPQGPYILGGWCYGGIVAHEMACQLQAMGETVEHLILLDSHIVMDERIRKAAEAMHSAADRHYFETSALFEDMRQQGMLEALIENSRHVGHDMIMHIPSRYSGPCLYFKPKVIPAATAGGARDYWELMMKEYDAGGYENYCDRNSLTVIETPHEHDLMMDSDSLDIIVPRIYEALTPGKKN